MGIRKMYSWLHKCCEIHVVMNLLTLGVFLEMVLGGAVDIRYLLFILYGMGVPVLTTAKVRDLILNQKIDLEFEKHFHEIQSERQ